MRIYLVFSYRFWHLWTITASNLTVVQTTIYCAINNNCGRDEARTTLEIWNHITYLLTYFNTSNTKSISGMPDSNWESRASQGNALTTRLPELVTHLWHYSTSISKYAIEKVQSPFEIGDFNLAFKLEYKFDPWGF